MGGSLKKVRTCLEFLVKHQEILILQNTAFWWKHTDFEREITGGEFRLRGKCMAKGEDLKT